MAVLDAPQVRFPSATQIGNRDIASEDSMADFIFIVAGAALWALMVLLVRGLHRLDPAREQRP
jgi:hypothetical protein